MNPHQRFKICQQRARQIVAAYRAEAPEGCDPQNTWVAIGVGVAGAAVSAGTSMYANKKKADATKSAMGKAGAAFGSVPEAAPYKPLDFNQEQLLAIFQNQGAQDDIGRLVFGTNKTIDNDAIRRASRLIPGYKSAMQTYGAAGNDLLNGRLPYSDVLDIVSNRADLANSLGTPGAAGPATLKDLGLSQLDAIKAGGGILKDMVGMAETISPIGRHMTPQSNMIAPLDRIQLGMQQNQLIQQSQQSANNLAASGDPAAYAQLQLQLAQAGNDAATTQAYGQAANQLIGAVGTGYQNYLNSKAGAAGAWSGNTSVTPGATPSFYYSRPAYYNGSIVPRATAA